MEKIQAVIAVVVRNGCVLLARKQRKINNGFLTPYGGKLEPQEREAEAVIRELRQESGLSCNEADIEKVGFLSAIDVYLSEQRREYWEIPIYLVHKCWGELKNNPDEMCEAKFFPIENLPTGEMSPLDNLWMPVVLEGKNPTLYAVYEPERHWISDFYMKISERPPRKP